MVSMRERINQAVSCSARHTRAQLLCGAHENFRKVWGNQILTLLSNKIITVIISFLRLSAIMKIFLPSGCNNSFPIRSIECVAHPQTLCSAHNARSTQSIARFLAFSVKSYADNVERARIHDKISLSAPLLPRFPYFSLPIFFSPNTSLFNNICKSLLRANDVRWLFG